MSVTVSLRTVHEPTSHSAPRRRPPWHRPLPARLAVAAGVVALLGALLPAPVVLATAPSATAIAAGEYHSCALLSDGTVDCWGYNAHGQLGNGTTTDSSTPVAVSGITSATAIAAGGYGHTCAVLSGGSVECWGWNSQGELGNGTTTDSSIPVAVSGITSATALAAGDYYTCALLSGGSVDCWGNGYVGQLGNGTYYGMSGNPSYSAVPVAVSGITSATAIAAGSDHTCALISGGSVECWGDDYHGELGNGASGTESFTPVAVSGITSATAIAAGDSHSCAVLSGGAAECWGYNGYGQLGTGTTTDSAIPVAVSGITSATAIAAGGGLQPYGSTCALLSGGNVDCWGYNGQYGLGLPPGPYLWNSTIPVAVSGLTGVTALAVGTLHTCAVLSGGSVECWGYNSSGQLGNGTTTTSSTPVPVSGITGSSGGGLTPTGTNVAVVPSYAGGTSPVSMTFGTVTAPGVTTLTTSTTAPALPGGFAIGSPATYYDLTTTATYSGTITVCISYAGITPAPTSLLHYDAGLGAWVNITSSIDTTTQTICGTSTSLSPFALVTLTFAYPTRGAFVIGDQGASVGASVTWWSPQWSSANHLSGGTAPSAFKGFAGTLSGSPPAVGGTWSTAGGQGASPPLTVPTYMAVIVTGSVTKSGSTISGTDARIAVVRVDPGYDPVTGTPGTGTLLGFLP